MQAINDKPTKNEMAFDVQSFSLLMYLFCEFSISYTILKWYITISSNREEKYFKKTKRSHPSKTLYQVKGKIFGLKT